jgi:hypothetical protein
VADGVALHHALAKIVTGTMLDLEVELEIHTSPFTLS